MQYFDYKDNIDFGLDLSSQAKIATISEEFGDNLQAFRHKNTDHKNHKML